MEYSQKERLLLLIPLPPPFHGSNIICQYVTESKALREFFNVSVFPLRYASSISDIGSFRLAKLWVLIKNLIFLIYTLAKVKPDYVYFVPAISGLSFFRECVYALLIKLFNIPIIYHLHGKGISDYTRNPILKRIYTWFFHDEHIIHLSPLLYEDIANVVHRRQVHFLANGIRTPERLDLDGKNDRSNGRVTILFLSNLIPSKGPVILLDACARLKKLGYDFKAIFVGNPSNDLSKEKFEDLVKQRDLENHVHYAGPKYGEEKTKMLTSADILAFPTFFRKECFPLILLEAMACGLPVVTTNEGAIPEIIEDGMNGFIVPRKDTITLSDRLALLISNPDQRLKMGEAGRQKYLEHYHIEAFEEHLIDVMNKIIYAQ